ncbi:MAG: alpha/beta hydrolase [Methylotenera sp.]|nr:alpha/beta hydrolase [Oligoflexia bacterium]
MELGYHRYPFKKEELPGKTPNISPDAGTQNAKRNPKETKLLFLHGMGGTGALWRPVAAALEDDFDILAPDQRGHGRSQVQSVPAGLSSHGKGSGFTPLDYGRDLVDTLTALQFHPTWVIGHSMGVRSACALAHLKPEWVQGLLLIDLGFSGPAGGGLGDGLANFLKKLPPRFDSRAQAKEFMAQECPDPSIAQYLMAVSVPEPGTAGITFPFDRSALIQTIEAARDTSVRKWIEEFGKSGKPVLVLRGALSQVWTHEEFMKEKHHLSGFSSIQFEEVHGASHGLPFEKRLEFVERLRRLVTPAT